MQDYRGRLPMYEAGAKVPISKLDRGHPASSKAAGRPKEERVHVCPSSNHAQALTLSSQNKSMQALP